MRNCQQKLYTHVHVYTPKNFVKNVWPTNVALFVFVSSHYAEIIKYIDYTRYTWWSRCNEPDNCVRCPSIDLRIGQGFYVCFLVWFCNKLAQKHNLSSNFTNTVAMFFH